MTKDEIEAEIQKLRSRAPIVELRGFTAAVEAAMQSSLVDNAQPPPEPFTKPVMEMKCTRCGETTHEVDACDTELDA